MSSVMRSAMCVGIIVAWATCAHAQGWVETNVPYGMYSGLALLMDVHHPERPNGIGIVGVPGSGWNAPLGLDTPGLKDSAVIDDWSKTLTAAGYTLFAVNHRASPRFEYPAAVEDVQRAVRFVRANAKRFGINPDRLGALGASSGGHLVSLAGVLDGAGAFDDPDPINRLSSRVQAVVAVMTPFDLAAVRTPDGGRLVALFVGAFPPGTGTAPSSPEAKRYAAASPIAHVTPDDAPFLLFHGDADNVVPFEQSGLMEAALRKAGVPVKFVVVPGGRHGRTFGFPPGDSHIPDYVDAAVKWFDLYLRQGVPH